MTILRRPRDHGVGGKLTIFKDERGWHVCYVQKVDRFGTVWSLPHSATTTWSPWGPVPFSTWERAMEHAATLRTWYGDQCRGDNRIFDQKRRDREAVEVLREQVKARTSETERVGISFPHSPLETKIERVEDQTWNLTIS